mmetsp:Transcript_25213/g.58729  ORF Transcript_25213/g.58729 Transcript_25213/m.58729 type:complete len:239 (-) Transcript_25213:81-797(-)
MMMSMSLFSARTRFAPLTAAMDQSVALLPSPQVGDPSAEGLNSLRKSKPTTSGSLRYRAAISASPCNQAPSEYFFVYQRPSPSVRLQHQPLADTWLLRITMMPRLVNAATVASKTSSGDESCSSGFAPNDTSGFGTREKLAKSMSRLNGKRTQLKPNLAMESAMSPTGRKFRPFAAICSMWAPYQLTHASRVCRPSESITCAPCVRRGSCTDGSLSPSPTKLGMVLSAIITSRVKGQR